MIFSYSSSSVIQSINGKTKRQHTIYMNNSGVQKGFVRSVDDHKVVDTQFTGSNTKKKMQNFLNSHDNHFLLK